MGYQENEYYQRKCKRRWKVMGVTFKYLPLILIIVLAVALFLSGCKATEDIASQEKREVKEEVILKADNRGNCTDAIVSSLDGRIYKLVPAGQSRKLTIETTPLNEIYGLNLLMQTPQEETRHILAGDSSILPGNCENWGRDTQSITLRDGDGVKTVKIRLHPPIGWDISDYEKKVSSTF